MDDGEQSLEREQVIRDFTLRLTCESCPEQYEVYKGEKQVGYLRLRHGIFRVDVPDSEVNGMKTVYVTNQCAGDGQFRSDEREYWLEEACRAIEMFG